MWRVWEELKIYHFTVYASVCGYFESLHFVFLVFRVKMQKFFVFLVFRVKMQKFFNFTLVFFNFTFYCLMKRRCANSKMSIMTKKYFCKERKKLKTELKRIFSCSELSLKGAFEN